jgi:hypothetical protein
MTMPSNKRVEAFDKLDAALAPLVPDEETRERLCHRLCFEATDDEIRFVLHEWLSFTAEMSAVLMLDNINKNLRALDEPGP